MTSEEISKAIDAQIARLTFGEKPKSLYEPIRYIMGLGGKRIRPLLTCLAYAVYRRDIEKVIPAAVAVETFHNFTLMHDDIMDEAPLRRGKRTVHEKWNMSTAILSGDVMLVKVYEMLGAVVEDQQVNDVLRMFNRTAIDVCEGQQLDMEFETAGNVSEQQYVEMIRLKTASLLGFSLQLGAYLAGASSSEQKALRSFGVNMGIAFQLRDDFLDVYGDRTKFGKQVGGDIISNKKTFLLIKAAELAKGRTKSELSGWTKAKTFVKSRKIKAVTAIYDRLNIPSLAQEKIMGFYEQSVKDLSSVNGDTRSLLAFAGSLVERQR